VVEPGAVALPIRIESSVAAIAFSPDSTRIACGGNGADVRVMTIGFGAPLTVPSSGFVSSLAFSPDGSMLAVADLDQVFLYSCSTGEVIWQGPVEAQTSVNSVRFTGDGKTLLAATDMVVQAINVSDGVAGRRITVERPLIADLDLSRDGTRVVLAIDERHGGDHRNAGSARVIDLATGTSLGTLTPEDAVTAVAFSPDATRVLCCAADDTVRMFDPTSGEQLWPLPDEVDDQETSPSCLAFDPKGRWTVIGGADGFARILDAASGTERGRAPKLPPDAVDVSFGAVTHVAFSPTGSLAASACIDNQVRLFNLDGKERVAVSTDEVLTMSFSPNGQWLGLGFTTSATVLNTGDPGTV
jgi:WD40 repeat protein